MSARRKHLRHENGVEYLSACGRNLSAGDFPSLNIEVVDCQRCRSTWTWNSAINTLARLARRHPA